MKNGTRLMVGSLLLLAASSCTAVTEFSEFSGGYSLKDKIQTPVVVSLSGTSGSLELSFASALPEAEDDELFALIRDKIINVEVSQGTTGTTYSLTQGLKVSDEPDDNGEYRLDLSEDRKVLHIDFYNSFEGAVLQVGQTYAVLIEVVGENEFFAVGPLAINDVDVVAE